MHTIKRRRQVVVAELVRAVAVDEEVVGVEEASLIAPTRTSSLIGKLDRVPVHWRDRPHACSMVHKRVIAPTRTSSLIGKLDRQA